MTSTVEEHAQHETPHGHAPRRRGILMRPGYVRALWCTALFFLIGMYIVVTLRWIAGWYRSTTGSTSSWSAAW